MSINTIYNNTPLDEESFKLYQTDFVDFGTILRNTLNIVTTDYQRLFIRPFLWKLLVVVLPIIFLIVAFAYRLLQNGINYEQFNSNITLLTTEESSLVISEFSSWLASNYAGSVLAFLSGLIFFAIIGALINYRTMYLFNNTKIISIWQTPRSFYLSLFRIITVSLMYFFVDNLIDFVVNEPTITVFVQNIFALVFYGLFGLFEYLVVFEDWSINEALGKSFTYSKPYFWQNTIRWLLFSVTFFATVIGVAIASAIWIIPASLSGWNVILLVLLSVMILIGIGCFMLLIFVSQIFSYLSFLNLRLLGEKTNTAKSTKI